MSAIKHEITLQQMQLLSQADRSSQPAAGVGLCCFVSDE